MKYIQSGNLKGRDHLEDLGIDETIIPTQMSGCEVDSSGLGYGPVAGSYEHGNECSGSIKGRELLHQRAKRLLPSQERLTLLHGVG
jgi:hypothetical protein